MAWPKRAAAGARFAKVFGKEDKLISALSLDVAGGKELKIKFAISLKIIPRAVGRSATFEPDRPQQFKK